MPVAIERPNGRLVDLLLEAGHPVVPVSPNAIKAWRDGEVLSGAKSDAGDAAVIAEYLRLRAHKLKAAAPYSDETLALRTVVRTRGDMVEMRVAATNQLSALLDAHWPGAKAIFADVESADQPGVPHPLPDPGRRRAPGREADGRVPGQARLLRPPQRRRAARPPARRPGGRRRRGPRRGAPRHRARSRRRAHGPERLGQEPRPLGGRPPRGAPGRRDLHVAAKVGSGQRRPGARRVGRLPPSLRRARLRRRARRRAPRSPRNPASTAPCTSAGPATSDSAPRSPPSPTTAGTPAPGPPRSTTTPAPAARTTPTPSASWPAPGSASYGAAGSTASPTTPPRTEPPPRSPDKL